MRITLSSVFVDDQNKALQFYTKVLGFVKKRELPAGDFKWPTVVSPDGPDDMELLLEPDATQLAKTYQEGCFETGIPATSFAVEDIQGEYERMKGLGVVFHQEPTRTGPVIIAVFDDSCGNLVQLVQA